MNIYDISEKSGVSIATVSRVLNGSAHVSEKTRQKVLAVMEEEGYQPNAFARGLGLNTMKVIGILYSDSSDTFLSSAIYHLERNFRSHGYDSLLCCTGYILEDRQKYTQWILSKRVDALVLVGSHFVEENEDDNAYIRAAASQVPVAILGARLAGENIYCSLCDDYLSSIHLAESLFHVGSYRKKERAMNEKAMELLSVFGLENVADYKASNLPYGKQRKLEIARALATDPKLLLLDEPAAGMNPNETGELMETIELVRKKFGVTVLLIEHDMKLVSGICEYLYVLNFGRLLAEGTPAEVLKNPEVVTAYLGE